MVHDVTGPMGALAAELETRGLKATIEAAVNGAVRMRVRNPGVRALSEAVILHAGVFWWPWRDRIGPASDVTGAADAIARVLATLDAPSR